MALLHWRGWQAGGLNHPQHGRVNVTEALLQAVEYNWSLYVEYIEKFCKIAEAKDMIALVLWEQHKNRTYEDIEWLLQQV